MAGFVSARGNVAANLVETLDLLRGIRKYASVGQGSQQMVPVTGTDSAGAPVVAKATPVPVVVEDSTSRRYSGSNHVRTQEEGSVIHA